MDHSKNPADAVGCCKQTIKEYLPLCCFKFEFQQCHSCPDDSVHTLHVTIYLKVIGRSDGSD